MPNPIPIMLCADDYALTPGVSRGILDALGAGRLTATCAMTSRPSWPQAARDLAAFNGKADLGVHVNLTTGAPLGLMPAFAPAGMFPTIGTVAAGALLRRLPEREIRAEIARQLDAFEAAMGRTPDFVDGHQHVQVLPGIRSWLIEDMSRRGWAGKVWLRDSSDTLSAILRRRVEASKAAQVAALSLGFARAAAAAGFSTNRGFSGFSAFDPRRSYAKDFATYLKSPGPAHLVMCHPGAPDAELEALGEVTRPRQNELAFLLSDKFSTLLSGSNAVLARWPGAA